MKPGSRFPALPNEHRQKGASTMTVPPLSTFLCPSCGKVGTLARIVPAGTKVRCRCGTDFQTPGPDIYAIIPDLEEPKVAAEIVEDEVVAIPAVWAEPRSFVALEAVASIVMTLGAIQLAYFAFRYLDFLVRPQHADEVAPGMVASVLLLSLAVSTVACLASLVVGLGSRVAVDIARSLRRGDQD
jgi:hypothetical protein